jgi:hypothetical protein
LHIYIIETVPGTTPYLGQFSYNVETGVTTYIWMKLLIDANTNKEIMGRPLILIKPNRLYIVINTQLDTAYYNTCLMSWASPLQKWTDANFNDG